jgi:hypothetical protein
MRGSLVITCLLGLAAGSVAEAQPSEWPPVRFDNWLYFQHNLDGTDRWQYRPRFYIPFNLDGGWTFTQRIDLPMYYTDRVGPENPGGGWKFGIGDWFIEESLLSPAVTQNLKWSTSLRFVFPTGGKSPFGSSQYQVAPSLGLLYVVPEHNVTLNPIARYFFSYHEDSPGAAKIRKLTLFPTVTFGKLLGDWSLSFWPENEISYNDQTNKWFVPIDVLVTRPLSRSLEFGFGGAKAMVKDDPQYQYIINGRVTLRF